MMGARDGDQDDLVRGLQLAVAVDHDTVDHLPAALRFLDYFSYGSLGHAGIVLECHAHVAHLSDEARHRTDPGIVFSDRIDFGGEIEILELNRNLHVETFNSTSRHRRKECHFVARFDRRAGLRHLLVDRGPHQLLLGKNRLPVTAALHEVRSQGRDRAYRRGHFDFLGVFAELFFQAGEESHRHFHLYSSE
jgi:hypothetical protein